MEVTYELMYELMGPNEVTLKNPNMNDWFEMIWNDDMKWYELRTKIWYMAKEHYYRRSVLFAVAAPWTGYRLGDRFRVGPPYY